MEVHTDAKYLLIAIVLTFLSYDLAQAATPQAVVTQVPATVTTTAVPHNCSDNLTNIVVYEGSPASFQRLNNNQSVKWQVVPSSDLYGAFKSITNYDDNITEPFVFTYAVNKTELTVFNSTVAPQPDDRNYSTAGLYILRYQDPVCNYAANLIVIKSGPVCSCNASNPNSVQLVCSVDYARAFSQPNPPVFTWKNGASTVKQQTPIASSVNFYVKRATSNLPITRTDPTTYECQLTFGSPPKSPFNYITTTAPNFTASCFISNCELTTIAGTETTTSINPFVSTTAVMTTAVPHNCSDNLTNIVVYEGSPASFQRLNNNQSVKWQVVPSSDLYGAFKSITNYDDNITEPFAFAYAVNKKELTVFNSTVAPQPEDRNYSTAGLYILRYQDPVCNYAANLIVISSGPVCSCNASNPNSVQLVCSVDYARAFNQPNPPVFTWKNGASTVKQQTPIASSVNFYLKRATSNLPITSNDPTTYECQLTFGSPPKSPFNYITTTPPNFTASCFISNCAIQATTLTGNSIAATTKPVVTTTTPQCIGQNLTNTVVYEGSLNTTFRRLNNGQVVQWQYIPSNSFYNSFVNITTDDGKVADAYASAYVVTQSGLMVVNATVEPQGTTANTIAGIYAVNYRNPNCTYAAHLIVIRSGPACSCNTSSTSTNVNLSCSVDFAGSPLQRINPVFTWKNGASVVQQLQPTPKQVSAYLWRSTTQLSIASNDPSPYACQLTFGSPSQNKPFSYLATTAPNFTAVCFAPNCALMNGQNGQPSALGLGATLDEETGLTGSDGAKVIVGLVIACVLTAFIAFGVWYYRFRASKARQKKTWEETGY